MTEAVGLGDRTNGDDFIHRRRDAESIEMQPLKNKENRDEENDMFEDEPSMQMVSAVVIGPDNGASSPIEIDAPWNLEDWLFPPQLPPELQLLRRENIAIPACYLLVGILQGLSGPLINVYPLDLNATEAQQTTISTLKSLPASLKLIFGFISDNFPICGYRRKSYMFIGWAISAAAFGCLLFTSDLSLTEEEFRTESGETEIRTVVPTNAPSIKFFSLMTFFFGTGESLQFIVFQGINRTVLCQSLSINRLQDVPVPGKNSFLKISLITILDSTLCFRMCQTQDFGLPT